MPRPTAAELRSDEKLYRNYVRSYSHAASFQLVPVRQWHGEVLAVLQRPDLIPDAQTINVIDITRLPDAARFSTVWPQQAYDHDHALVIWPDEGQAHILLEDGSHFPVYIAALPVQVVAPTREDAQAALDQVDDNY